MNDEIFFNDLDQKIAVSVKTVIKQVLVNLNFQIRQQMQAVSLTSTLLTVSQSVFKIEKIEYFHSDFDGVKPSVGKPPLVNPKNYIDIDNSDPYI